MFRWDKSRYALFGFPFLDHLRNAGPGTMACVKASEQVGDRVFLLLQGTFDRRAAVGPVVLEQVTAPTEPFDFERL